MSIRQVLNFFILGALLWISSLLFPEHIKFDNFGAIVLVTFLYYAFETIVAFGYIYLMIAENARRLWAWLIGCVFVLVFSGAGILLVIDMLLDLFWISGFWTAVLLAFASAFCTTSLSVNAGYRR